MLILRIGDTVGGGALEAVGCALQYLLGRVGILMLRSDTLFILGIILLSVGGCRGGRHGGRGQGPSR
jgi:hypothetical protein